MDDPMVSRRPSPRALPSPSSASPLPTRSFDDDNAAAASTQDNEGDTDMASAPLPLPETVLPRSSNPLTFLASSSPSRALSRMWDRFSPPSLPHAFPLHPPTHAPVPTNGADGLALDPSFRRPNLPSGAVTPAEERQLASQLSFSLRRGSATSTVAGNAGRDGRPTRSRGFSAGGAGSSSGGGNGRESWEPPTFRLLPDVRMPAVLQRTRRGKAADGRTRAGEEEEDEAMVDDEACFVDGWEGKVDFLVSLPSELSLSILLHLDFRSVLAASAVSQQWRYLALDPLLWRELFHQNPGWALKDEIYQAVAEAAARAAAAASASQAGTPMPGSPFASGSGGGGGYFDHKPFPSPSMPPSLKRAASSFSRAAAASPAAARRAADRVSSSGAAIGRKLSEIAGDLGGLSIVPQGAMGGRGLTMDDPMTGDAPSTSTTAAASTTSSATTRPMPSRRPTSSNVASHALALASPFAPSAASAALSSSSSTAGPGPTAHLASLPSTSAVPTHAFASPPSAAGALSRSGSSTALSSLSNLPTASSYTAGGSGATPARGCSLPRRQSTRTVPTTPIMHYLPTHSSTSVPPTPYLSSSSARASLGADRLDWPRLFRDRFLLDRRWARGKPAWNWLEGHEDGVYCLQFDRERVVSGSRDRTIRIWDLASGQVTRTLTGHEGSVLCLQYDRSILVSGSSDSRILVWDLEPGSKTQYEVKMQLVGHAMGVLDLCFDDEWIVSCSKDTTTRVWHRSTGALYRTLAGHRGPVNAVQLNGSHILSASGDATMKLWDLHTGQALRTFTGHSRGLACVHWARSGKFFVSGSNDKTIKLWDAESGACVQTFVGHQDLVRSLWYDERSNRVVSASYDRTTRVWDAETGKQVQKFKSHASLVFDVAFDASRIVSCSHDQRILVMDFGVGLDVDKFA
ncbi:hypothetical protein JCM8097_009426 [Rhodosporidiobolus ruineniae]